MTLSSETTYPGARRYVLKLHRDAAPAQGRLVGRLENMSSGRLYDFASGEELLACFSLDMALNASDTQTASPI
jgi:hypothetical protein